MDISLKINDLRKIKQISQRELSTKVGLSLTGLQKALEKNDFKTSTLVKIAEVLGVPVGYFFEEGDEPPVTQNFNSADISMLKNEIKMLKKIIEQKDQMIEKLLNLHK